MVMIGPSPSLPLSALDLAHQQSQGGQCLSCIVHRHTPRLKRPHVYTALPDAHSNRTLSNHQVSGSPIATLSIRPG
jgi:hypothetical protein